MLNIFNIYFIMVTKNGWKLGMAKWQGSVDSCLKSIEQSLKRNTEEHDKIFKELEKIHTEISKINSKISYFYGIATVLGFIGGILVNIIIAVIK